MAQVRKSHLRWILYRNLVVSFPPDLMPHFCFLSWAINTWTSGKFQSATAPERHGVAMVELTVATAGDGTHQGILVYIASADVCNTI